jgi:two-component system, OmpR family, copper resistance phosphate regulon response regulator CusR
MSERVFRNSSGGRPASGSTVGVKNERPGTVMRVLIIEDDYKVAGAVRSGLAAEGYEATVSRTGEDGYFRATTEPFDAVLLDLGLPGRSGLEILRSLRARTLMMPILVLTARDSIEDRVLGLDSGADDYLVKPFAFAELLARLRALLRRGRPEDAVRIRLADLELDPINRSARRGDRPIELTAREFELLDYLVRHQGQIVSREMLARDVWKEPSRGTPLDNVIDVHMMKLRKKVDQGFATRLIHTIRGVGFTTREGEL